MRQIVLVALLFVAGMLHPCRAGAIFASFDDASLTSQLSNSVRGMTVVSSSLLIVTSTASGSSQSLYSDALFTATQTVNPVVISPDLPGIKLGPTSLVTSFGTTLFMTGSPITLYTFDTSIQTVTPYTADLPDMNGGIAVSGSGQLYIDPMGSSPALYSVATSGALAPFTLITQLSPYVTNAVGLGVGPNGLLYTMGPAAANLGNCTVSEWCVVAFDPLTGNLVENFSAPESLTNGALAFGPTGLLFLSDGDGQGYVYTASGGLVDTLSSTAMNPYAAGGTPSLVVDGNNDVYMFDAATGLHVFEVAAAPEPGTIWLLVAGLALFGGRAANARRRNCDKARAGKQN